MFDSLVHCRNAFEINSYSTTTNPNSETPITPTLNKEIVGQRTFAKIRLGGDIRDDRKAQKNLFLLIVAFHIRVCICLLGQNTCFDRN